VYAFFRLWTLEVWGRQHFRQQSDELLDEQMLRLEHRQISREA
jgi:hypothetical protein